MENKTIEQLIADVQERLAAENDGLVRALFEAELAAYKDARDLVARHGLTQEARSMVFNTWYKESVKQDRQDLPLKERLMGRAYGAAGVSAELALFGERR